MKPSPLWFALLLAGSPLLAPAPGLAWASANRFGGSSFHGWGESGHSNAWGGSTEHVAGEGTEHTNAWGGDTEHAYGGGTEHTNVYGGTTAGAYGAGVVHTDPAGVPVYGGYPAYHPPVAVPYYSSTGCYGCAAAAGAIVGAGAGYAAAAAAAPAAAPLTVTPVAGGSYAMLPPGAIAVSRLGTTYYLSGNTWYQPVYGANGVFYQVVPAP
jgi:hypothetical protein